MVFKRKLPNEVVEFILDNCKNHSIRGLKKQVLNRFDVIVSEGACEYYFKRYIQDKHVMRGKCKPSFLTKPVGTERKDKDGYIRVIVDTGKERLKHHIVWEREHEPVKNTEILMFLDGDKTNCDINNLILVKRMYLGAINSILKDIEDVTPQMRKTAILSAELLIEARNKDIQRKKNSPHRKPKKDDFKDIILLHKQGLTTSEIAKKLNKSKPIIRWTIRRYMLGCYEGY